MTKRCTKRTDSRITDDARTSMREAEKQRAPKKRQDSQINKVFPLQIVKKEDLKKNNYVVT